ncbi:MAG: ATPase, T2SS/T4P/T4SS family [Candidatus Geothermarchaeota archaeon]
MVLKLELMIDEGKMKDMYKTIGPYRIYLSKRADGIYQYLPRIPAEYVPILPYLRTIYEKYPTANDLKKIGHNLTFEKLYNVVKESILSGIKEVCKKDISEKFYNIDEIVELLSWEILGLTRIAPFLLDDEIEEVFIDGVNNPIYARHARFGICVSDISVLREELDALLTQVELHKGIGVDTLKGNIESELEFEKFHLRVNIDLDPLAVNGPNIVIRNLRKKRFTIVDLINNGTLSADAAAFLILSSWLKLNITIAGSIGAGKTTLLNAIDMALPKRYRRLYIEDALEAIDKRKDGYFQAFYRAETYSTVISKRRQITFSLHRSPDVLIFGEILTDSDVKAFFYSLSCGLRGLQTIHANSVDALFRRWLLYHKVPVDSLKDLDLIVFMKKDLLNKRYVEGIYEVYVENNYYRVNPIFKWYDGTLMCLKNISETLTFKKMLANLNDKDKLVKMYFMLIDALSDARDSFYERLNELERVFFETHN